MNALYDKAFDRGLITFDDDLRLVLSTTIRKAEHKAVIEESFLKLEGAVLAVPYRFRPGLKSLEYHRENIFEKL